MGGVCVCVLGHRTQRSRAANKDTQSALRQDSCEVACEILTVAPPPSRPERRRVLFWTGSWGMGGRRGSDGDGDRDRARAVDG